MAYKVYQLPKPTFSLQAEEAQAKVEENKALIIWLRMVKEHAEVGSSESRGSLAQLISSYPLIENPTETLSSLIALVSQAAKGKLLDLEQIGLLAEAVLRELGAHVPNPSPPIRRPVTPVEFQ